MLSEIYNIANFGGATITLPQHVRADVYKLTGFEMLEPKSENAEKAKHILEGPIYRMLSRPDRKQPYDVSWLSIFGASQLYDSGFLDVEFGQLVLENGEIRPMTGDDQRAVSDAADSYSASK